MTSSWDPDATFDQGIGKNVARWRQARGLSQADLATRMRDRGYSFQQQTVLKIEKGARPLRLHEAVDLAAALELGVDELATTPSLEVIRSYRDFNAALDDVVEAVLDVLIKHEHLRAVIDQHGAADPGVVPQGLATLRDLTAEQMWETVATSVNQRIAGAPADTERPW